MATTQIELPKTQAPLGGGHARETDLDHPLVDLNFENTTRMDAGHVPVLQPVDESRIDEFIAREFSQPTGCSQFARCLTCAVAGVTIVGLFGICAKLKMIKPDELGLARGFDGKVFILRPGCRVVETLYREVKVFNVGNNNIFVHPMHIIRILPGYYGLCKIDGIPKIMAPGRHFINDPLFTYSGAVPATSPYIQNKTVHIIIVPTGKVAVCQVKGVGHILEAGQHWINNPDFVFDGGFVDANQEYIRSQAKHRILIPVGKVGLGWRKNEGVLLEANKAYYIDDADFKYGGSESMLQEKIDHGAFKIITVNKGLVGVAFDDGILRILPAGRHIVKRETYNFSSFLSTGQETIPIAQITNLSSDNVGLTFSAALNIQVMDAAKAVTMLGRDLSKASVSGSSAFSSKTFQNNIRDRARLALSIIIGNNPFTETFLSTAGGGVVDEDAPREERKDDSFKGIIHDAFMTKFSAEMMRHCGIKVIDMSISDIEIVNEGLSHALAQAAVKATELEMAKIDRDVETQRANTAMRSLKIRAHGEGRALKVEALAQAEEIKILAAAECARIRDIDQALASTCEATRVRELIRATGDAVGASTSAVVVASNVTHMVNILSGDK